MSKKPVLVVMAAGMGSRYGGLKQIDPVDEYGNIIMDFSIYDAVEAGFEKVVFIIKKAIEKDADTIKQQLMNDLGDNETGFCGRYTVNWKGQSRQTFDARAFAKDHPGMDLSGYYKTTNFRKFAVKEDKER